MSRYWGGKKWRPQVRWWPLYICCKCTVIDEIVQMSHYLLYTSALVTGNKEKMGKMGRESPRGNSCLNEYPSCQFHSDLWRVSPKQGTNDLHTWLSEKDISGQGFPYLIPLRLQDPCRGSVCLSVCKCICVCVLLSKTDIELVLGAQEHCRLDSTC